MLSSTYCNHMTNTTILWRRLQFRDKYCIRHDMSRLQRIAISEWVKKLSLQYEYYVYYTYILQYEYYVYYTYISEWVKRLGRMQYSMMNDVHSHPQTRTRTRTRTHTHSHTHTNTHTHTHTNTHTHTHTHTHKHTHKHTQTHIHTQIPCSLLPPPQKR